MAWSASSVAALLLCLGTSGALASWTAATITNDTNTVATAGAVILRETDGTTTCETSSTGSNSATCSTINKYGGVAAPLTPGTSRTQTVTFTNLGTADAATFSLAPGACTQTPAAGTGAPAAGDLCSSGDLTVAISCSAGSTYSAGSAWTDLAYPAAKPPTATKAHSATAGDLDGGASWTCTITVALAAAAPVSDQGIQVSQLLTWTLTQ